MAPGTDTMRRPAQLVRIPHEASGVSAARRQVVVQLQSEGVSHATLVEAELVLSELLGNAVRHARPLEDGGVRLRWQLRAGVIDVEVTDGGGSGPPVVRRHQSVDAATSGRGLRIVRSLAHEWGVHEDTAGSRTVWAAVGGPSRRRRG